MNEESKEFFAKLYLHKAGSDNYVDWAIACLEDGFDSKNLRMLAATDKPLYPAEIEDRFQNALKELGWNYPSKRESLMNYPKKIAEKIVSGELPPDEGCRQIYLISLELDYPEELKDWIWLDEGHDPVTNEWLWDEYSYSEGKKSKWFEVIIREAKKLAETNFS